MFQKILVALDGSAAAEKAIPYAVDLAKSHDGEVHLLRICSFPMLGVENSAEGPYPVPPSIIETELEVQASYLDRLELEWRPKSVQMILHCHEGDPEVEILRVAHELACDAIILTAHGKSGVTQFFLGSVAESVARQALCPVLIVGRSDLPPCANVAALVGKNDALDALQQCA